MHITLSFMTIIKGWIERAKDFQTSTTHTARIQLNHSDSPDASTMKQNKHASSTIQKNGSTSCLTWHFLSKNEMFCEAKSEYPPSIMIPSYIYCFFSSDFLGCKKGTFVALKDIINYYSSCNPWAEIESSLMNYQMLILTYQKT